MRFETVDAIAFGPFRERRMQFAPGLTVICGANETGKSTWRAAMYAALCGVRRGRGQPKAEDREFAQKHRPWDGDSWEVVGVFKLEDGARVELRQGLDGDRASRATDLKLKLDVSAGISSDGALDGSRWLGLDRRAFRATACIDQAHVLDVLVDANALQTHLQRAAATAGTDETAAAALALLHDYRSAQVGSDRSNSTKPLRKAIERVDAARSAAQAARQEHDHYLLRASEAVGLAVEAERLEAKARLLEALVARQRSAALQLRFQRAVDLHNRIRQAHTPGVRLDDDLALRIAGALQAWSGRPDPHELVGPSSTEVRKVLESLPTVPAGDLEPAPDVLRTERDLAASESAIESHITEKPQQSPSANGVNVTADILRELAREFDHAEPLSPDPLVGAVSEPSAVRAADPRSHPGEVAMLLGAGISILAGLVLLVAGQALIGTAIVAIGFLLGFVLVGLAVRRQKAVERLVSIDLSLGLAAREQARERKRQASARALALNVPTDPHQLRSMAAESDLRAAAERDLGRWEQVHEDLLMKRAKRERLLRESLEARGVTVDGEVWSALDRYREDCLAKAELARAASRRPDLERQIADREAAEDMAREASRTRDHAAISLRAVAMECGVEWNDETANELRRWLERRAGELVNREERLREVHELEGLLGTSTLEELEANAVGAGRSADELLAKVGGSPLGAIEFEGDVEDQLRRYRATLEQASRLADEAVGEVKVLGNRLASVPEAEEELVIAELELARVRRLDETLSLTQEYLENAQAQVHRDVAPILAATLKEWLADITAGRYTDASVDGSTLQVQVAGASRRWRNASSLSHGTCEQIYLLLRMAMVEHLTKQGEVCPLILDDVTAQCDYPRTIAIMDLLHKVSAKRQVIVFSQEETVRAWAVANVREPEDRLEMLGPAPDP